MALLTLGLNHNTAHGENRCRNIYRATPQGLFTI